MMKRVDNSVIKSSVDKLNLTHVTPNRAGVILYTVVNTQTYLGLGLDSRYHEITDFGGGIIYKTDKNVIEGALREFMEETLHIFRDITIDDIRHCPVIYDDSNLLIFIHVDNDPETISKIFNQKFVTETKHQEVCGITWLSWAQFLHVISERDIMFSRLRNFLKRAGDFSYLL